MKFTIWVEDILSNAMLCKDHKRRTMTENERESFVRWQAYQIGHLSFSINLFLGFSVASIAYVFASHDSVRSNGFDISPQSYIALFWWLVSAVSGVFSTITRLVDFRYTARRVRAGRKGFECVTMLSGHGTWVFFGVALASYCIGAWYFLSEIF
ncbi:MAG: hypothetical protein JAY74_13160 [Candidatus Thiodiazotropha taylori]|nr:hypothetical protein [Candidatus Thiodiazotropha taylori]